MLFSMLKLRIMQDFMLFMLLCSWKKDAFVRKKSLFKGSKVELGRKTTQFMGLADNVLQKYEWNEQNTSLLECWLPLQTLTMNLEPWGPLDCNLQGNHKDYAIFLLEYAIFSSLCSKFCQKVLLCEIMPTFVKTLKLC